MDIELREYGAPTSIPLDDSLGRVLLASQLVDAAPDPNLPGYWRIRAGGTVGVAKLHTPNGHHLTLRIYPKVPVSQLIYLLGYARSPGEWQSQDVPVSDENDVLPAFAAFFVATAEQALRQGLINGYRDIAELALLVRGRIRTSEQVRRHHGRLIPLEIEHDEFTADIVESRLLRTAVDVLLRLPGVADRTRVRLLRLRLLLADIKPLTAGQKLPSWRPSRLNRRYHGALRLAELVLSGASIEHRPGDVPITGFLFDMAKVFEDFLTAALCEAFAERSGHCVRQARRVRNAGITVRRHILDLNQRPADLLHDVRLLADQMTEE